MNKVVKDYDDQQYWEDGEMLWSVNDIVQSQHPVTKDVVIGVIDKFYRSNKVDLILKRTAKGIIPKKAKKITVEISTLKKCSNLSLAEWKKKK